MALRGAVVALAWLFLAWSACTAASESEAPRGPESPQLQALAAALDAHDANALAAFWKHVAAERSPLIEAVPGRPADVLYTFLWHGEANQEALNVRFNGMFPLHTPKGFDAFTRLGNSDVWYTSYILSRRAHLRYELVAPKGWHASPERNTSFTLDGVEYETFTDPLNGRVSHWGWGPDAPATSYVAGPDAKTSPYLQKLPGVAAGSMQQLDIESNIPAHRRTLRIYLPAQYRSSTRAYGLLLVFDANQYTMAVPTPLILDNMIAAGVIPPVVAVFMESPDRDVELPPNDAFQKFLAEELLPQVRAHYRISRDPRRNTVLGSSYGGIGATYTAFSHPEVFGNVISQSGSYWWSPESAAVPGLSGGGLSRDAGWLIKRMAESPRKNIRFCLEAGLWEGSSTLMSNRMLRSVLLGKGYAVAYHENPGNHSAYYWMLSLPDALQESLGR